VGRLCSTWRNQAGLKLRAGFSDDGFVGYSNQATSDGGRRPRPEARTYDFRRPVRLAREDAHLLKVAMQTFGRQATTVLTTGLRALSVLSLVQVDEMSYDEYLGSLPEASVSAVLSMEPLQGKALLSIDLNTLLVMIDHLLGGNGVETQPDRALTDIEQMLVRHIFGRVLRELAYAFEPIAVTKPNLLALESNPQFVQAAAPTDPVVVARMQLAVGERTSNADLCLPYAMLAPALEAVTQSADRGEKLRQRSAASARTTQRLNDVEVDVSVRFDPLRLPSSQIGRLEVGDVITLGHRTSKPLSITSATSTFALAVPGASGRQLAALIVAPQ
jgi:flagellar motor switch protein FliM